MRGIEQLPKSAKLSNTGLLVIWARKQAILPLERTEMHAVLLRRTYEIYEEPRPPLARFWPKPLRVSCPKPADPPLRDSGHAPEVGSAIRVAQGGERYADLRPGRHRQNLVARIIPSLTAAVL